MYAAIPGSPDVIDGFAAALRDEAMRIDSARTRLSSLRAGSRWDSPAGRAFATRVAELPPLLGAVAERYAAAAAVLRTFATEFREAQEACSRAIVLRERGMLRRDRFAEAAVAAESSTSPIEQARAPQLRELMAQGIGEVLQQEAAYQRARERFEVADRRCARALGALLDDALTDGWSYNLVKGASRTGHDVAENAGLVGMIPPLKAAAAGVGTAASAVAVAADTGLKVAYGEGAWRPIIEHTGLGAAGFGAGGLLRAARVGAPQSAAHLGPSELLTPRERIVRGATAYAKEVKPWPVPNPGARAAPVGPPAGPTMRGRAQHVIARRLAQVRDDWRLASRNGADARAMLLTAYGLTAGTTVYEKAPKVGDAYERGYRVYERLRGALEQPATPAPAARPTAPAPLPGPAGVSPGAPTR